MGTSSFFPFWSVWLCNFRPLPKNIFYRKTKKQNFSSLKPFLLFKNTRRNRISVVQLAPLNGITVNGITVNGIKKNHIYQSLSILLYFMYVPCSFGYCYHSLNITGVYFIIALTNLYEYDLNPNDTLTKSITRVLPSC